MSPSKTSSRGQLTVEMLVILIGVLFYAIMFLSFADNTQILREKIREDKAQNLADRLAFIVNTVYRNPGMHVNLSLPDAIAGQDYNVSFENHRVTITVGEKVYASKMLVRDVRRHISALKIKRLTEIWSDGTRVRVQ